LIDEAYVAAGAIIGNAEQAFGCDVVLKVRAPDAGERTLMKPDAILIGMLNPFQPL
jgi:NAD(P) transhydrogenase subunit alpha